MFKGKPETLKQKFVKKDFTLVELLIVVAIIAILAAMLLPALSKALERGRSVTCLSNLKTLSMVHQDYAGSFDDFMMPVKWDSVNYGTKEGKDTYWNGYIAYFGNVPLETLYCPTMRITAATVFNNQKKNLNALQEKAGAGSWEYNGYGKSKTAGGHNHHPTIGRMSQTVHPSSSILLGESDGAADRFMANVISYQQNETSNQLYPFHDGTTNILWVDGHTSGIQGYTKDLIYARLGGYYGYQQVPLDSKWRIFR